MSDHSDNEDHFHDADASTPALEAAGVPTVFDAIPNLSANRTSIDASAMVADHQDRFLTPEAIRYMDDGGVVFLLRSALGAALTHVDKQYIAALANLTHFADEVAENNVPVVDIMDPAFAASITAVMVKTQYVAKGWRAEDFTPQFIASFEYQSACQPGRPTHVPDMPLGQMRFTKTIIPIVYKVTIQFDVSEVTDAAALKQLSATFGVRVDKAILMERTKRRIEVVDATLKCKSVLLYHNLADGSGVLIISATAILNTQIPAIAAKVLTGSSGMAAKEAAETAKLTRTYLQSVPKPTH